jgi:hypothetical protein
MPGLVEAAASVAISRASGLQAAGTGCTVSLAAAGFPGESRGHGEPSLTTGAVSPDEDALRETRGVGDVDPVPTARHSSA